MPPLVGKRSWARSSSHPQTGQVSKEPGPSAKTRYPQHGQGNGGSTGATYFANDGEVPGVRQWSRPMSGSSSGAECARYPCGRRSPASQTSDQGRHFPGVAQKRGTVDRIGGPPNKDVPESLPVDVVGPSRVVEAGSEEKSTTGAQDPPDFHLVLSAIFGEHVVKAAPIDHKIRHAVADRESSDVSDEELGTFMECLRSSDGESGPVDPQGPPPYGRQMRDLGAQSATDVHDDASSSDPPVRLGGE